MIPDVGCGGLAQMFAMACPSHASEEGDDCRLVLLSSVGIAIQRILLSQRGRPSAPSYQGSYLSNTLL